VENKPTLTWMEVVSDYILGHIGLDKRSRAQAALEKRLHKLLQNAEANEKAGERAGARNQFSKLGNPHRIS
jgi:hypothetical protein